jgi:hypothetical protein
MAKIYVRSADKKVILVGESEKPRRLAKRERYAAPAELLKAAGSPKVQLSRSARLAAELGISLPEARKAIEKSDRKNEKVLRGLKKLADGLSKARLTVQGEPAVYSVNGRVVTSVVSGGGPGTGKKR